MRAGGESLRFVLLCSADSSKVLSIEGTTPERNRQKRKTIAMTNLAMIATYTLGALAVIPFRVIAGENIGMSGAKAKMVFCDDAPRGSAIVIEYPNKARRIISDRNEMDAFFAGTLA